jgi:hypothetical protein
MFPDLVRRMSANNKIAARRRRTEPSWGWRAENQKGGNAMKRREFLKTAGVGLAASTTIAAPAIAQSMPELKWRCTTSWPKSLDVPFSASETISKYVAEATDNKFQIQPFAGGEIVPALQALDAVTNATVEMCHTAAFTSSARIRPSRCIARCRSGSIRGSRTPGFWITAAMP